MSKRGLTKIHHDHLEFVFNHEDHKIFVRDHKYKVEYELTPHHTPDLPFVIIKNRYLNDLHT